MASREVEVERGYVQGSYFDDERGDRGVLQGVAKTSGGGKEARRGNEGNNWEENTGKCDSRMAPAGQDG